MDLEFIVGRTLVHHNDDRVGKAPAEGNIFLFLCFIYSRAEGLLLPTLEDGF